MPDDDPTPPRQPINWTTIIMGLIGFATLCVQMNCNHEKTYERQVENAKDIKATEAKVDKAAEVAVEVEKKLTVQNATVEKTAEKVTEVHNAVKKMDK